MTQRATRHLRRKEVEEITGLSRSTIYLLMDRGTFPRPVKLTDKIVGWPETIIADWLASRPRASTTTSHRKGAA